MPVRYQNARTHSTVHSVRLSRDLGRTIIIRGFFYSLWNPANLESVHLEVIFSFLSNRVYFRVSSGRHLERRRARSPGVIIRDANRSNVILSSSASSHCRANVGLQTIFVIYFFFFMFSERLRPPESEWAFSNRSNRACCPRLQNRWKYSAIARWPLLVQ